MKFGFDWPSGFRVEDGQRTTDGRWLDGYTIISPCQPNGFRKLKRGSIS